MAEQYPQLQAAVRAAHLLEAASGPLAFLTSDGATEQERDYFRELVGAANLQHLVNALTVLQQQRVGWGQSAVEGGSGGTPADVV